MVIAMEQYLTILRRSPFFAGMTDEEILTVLHCVEAKVINAKKDAYILRSGDATDVMGLVLSGSAMIIQEDYWGHRNIISKCGAGDFFAEPYSATPGSILNLSVVAESDSDIMMLNTRRMLTTCPSACDHHNKLVRNLVAVMANKVLVLNDKITHVSKRSTKEKLLSYLSSEAMRQGKSTFDIPYDRQQLADFLCVERAAMSVELSKLQKEGVIKTTKNHFELLTDPVV